jgi:hypothetical protein
MVAALVFLNRFVTPGAVLGVGHNPCDVLALSRVLQVPLLRSLAVRRLVGLVAAFKAKRVAALAVDLHYPPVFIDHAVIAPRIWTPPHLLVVICI